MFLAKRFYSVDLNKVVILSFGGGGGFETWLASKVIQALKIYFGKLQILVIFTNY